jgi:hypothetical protein
MLRRFLVSGSGSELNIASHAFVMTSVARVAQVRGTRNKSHSVMLLIARHDSARVDFDGYPHTRSFWCSRWSIPWSTSVPRALIWFILCS